MDMFWLRTFILLLLPMLAMPAAQPAADPAGTMPAMPTASAPAAAPPAQPLPPVEMPTLTSPPPGAGAPVTAKPNLPALPQQPPVPTAPAPNVANTNKEALFSFGMAPYSLLFAPEQIDSMKRALTSYETVRRSGGAATIEIVEETPSGEIKLIDPVPYPTFTLHSVAFHNARDWTVWVGVLRITPRTNDQEVRVVAVSPQLVRFVWKPVYADVLRQRKSERSFADTKPVAHKMTKPNTAIFDAQGGQVMFSLKPNQTFVPGYMATFEGRMASPVLVPLKQPEVGDALLDGGISAAQQELGDETVQRMYQHAKEQSTDTTPQATIDTLLENEQNLKGLAPPRSATTSQ